MAHARPLAASAAVLACLSLTSCGGDGRAASSAVAQSQPISRVAANRSVTVVMAYTPSSEQRLLAQVYSQALERAGFRVLSRGVAAGAPAVAALERGLVSAYARFASLGPSGQGGLRRHGVTTLSPALPIRASGLAVLGRTARRLHLEKVSGLRDHAADMTLAVPRGCERRPDCLPALRRAYHLDFRRVHPVRPDLVHEALHTGRSQVSLVSTTDPHVRRGGEALLEDDRQAFPAAAPVVLVRASLDRRAGDRMRQTVQMADRGLTAEVMEELNARVEFDEEQPARVARDYLEATGLL